MIVTELLYRENEEPLVKHYSDQGFYILQNETGIIYPEAIDIQNSVYTYTETDIPIEQEQN